MTLFFKCQGPVFWLLVATSDNRGADIEAAIVVEPPYLVASPSPPAEVTSRVFEELTL